jgi:hypothetical protein
MSKIISNQLDIVETVGHFDILKRDILCFLKPISMIDAETQSAASRKAKI